MENENEGNSEFKSMNLMVKGIFGKFLRTFSEINSIFERTKLNW